MFGCCKYPQRVFQIDSETGPVLQAIQAAYPAVVKIERRVIELPRPHARWALIEADGTETLHCTCCCHEKGSFGIFC